MDGNKIFVKITKRYADDVVFILNTKTQLIEYYEGDRYMYSIVNVYSDKSFLHTNLIYEKVKGTNEMPELTNVHLKILL